MSVDLVTFGCRLNAYESEVIRAHAQEAGLADTIVVNTCAVTAEATRQARQAIRKLARERPGARIVVTGCAAQVEPARFRDMAEVDRVLGNTEKLDPNAWRDTQAPRAAVCYWRTASGHEVDFVLERGRDDKITDWLAEISAGCPRRVAGTSRSAARPSKRRIRLTRCSPSSR